MGTNFTFTNKNFEISLNQPKETDIKKSGNLKRYSLYCHDYGLDFSGWTTVKDGVIFGLSCL